jgi:outer membrane receptor protein involved in Fe transport
MYKKIFAVLVFVSILCSLGFSNIRFSGTGKVVGKVFDAETKEPLIGASVVILGTSYGASTNIDGEFIIVNVNPGTYSLKASYVGFADQKVEGVRVYADLTQQVDFGLHNKQLQTKEVVVIAEKPLINKNQTNSTATIKAEDIANLPVRDVSAIVANQSGVVRQNGNIYVRGSRSDAVAFYVDGVLVNDPLFGGSTTPVINNSIEEIQFQAGGFSAEFGGANAGIISTSTRTGKEEYQFSVEAITDNFVAKNSNRKMLGGYSYGSSEYVVTLSGPILPNDKRFKFYVAGSNNFDRSGARFWDGVNLPGLFDPSNPKDTVNLVLPAGYITNAGSQSWRVQGNVTADLKPMLFRLGGSFYTYNYRGGVGITDALNPRRTPYTEGYTGTLNLKTTFVASATAYLDLNLNYYEDYTATMDYDLRHNLFGYGDSVANAKYGYTLRADGQNPTSYSLYGQSIYRPGTQEAAYQKRHDKSYQVKLDYFWQIGLNNEIKTGVDYKRWTIRRYLFNYVFNLFPYVQEAPDDPTNWYHSLDNYGYDTYGNESNQSGGFAPKHPVFFGAYLQDKLEFNDLVVNGGLRLDYIDSDSKQFDNPHNIAFNADGTINQAHLVKVDPLLQVSPRLGFSFSLTDRAKFHAQYGKFVQQTRLRDIYQGLTLVSSNIKGGYAIQSPVGFGLRPERTTQYEIGFSQQLGDNLAFDVTGFYKDIKDQIQLRTIYAEQGAQHGGYYAYVNGDFSTTQGVELKLELRRMERLSGTINYTYSDARGTGSNPSSGFYAVWQAPTSTPYFPQNVAPLDFNQTHRGSINLDYRYIGDDGPTWLHNSGLNLLFTFNSGHNFTLVNGYGNAKVPLESLNESTTPWNFQLDLHLDKSIKIGTIDANIFVWVINVLNTKNVTDVFGQTGSTTDGYLQTAEGQGKINGYRNTYGEKFAQNYIALYNAMTNNNANIYGPPRQIRVGVKIDY